LFPLIITKNYKKLSCIFSRSITSSNRIAIVQHHDVPIKQVTSLEKHNSNSINCDIVENQTVVDSPKIINKNSIYFQRQDGGSTVAKPQKVYCEEQKSPVEDDDDSGVELGPFPFSSLDQDDNVNSGRPRIFFKLRCYKKILILNVDGITYCCGLNAFCPNVITFVSKELEVRARLHCRLKLQHATMRI
jgi:hypothetical protein